MANDQSFEASDSYNVFEAEDQTVPSLSPDIDSVDMVLDNARFTTDQTVEDLSGIGFQFENDEASNTPAQTIGDIPLVEAGDRETVVASSLTPVADTYVDDGISAEPCAELSGFEDDEAGRLLRDHIERQLQSDSPGPFTFSELSFKTALSSPENPSSISAGLNVHNVHHGYIPEQRQATGSSMFQHTSAGFDDSLHQHQSMDPPWQGTGQQWDSGYSTGSYPNLPENARGSDPLRQRWERGHSSASYHGQQKDMSMNDHGLQHGDQYNQPDNAQADVSENHGHSGMQYNHQPILPIESPRLPSEFLCDESESTLAAHIHNQHQAPDPGQGNTHPGTFLAQYDHHRRDNTQMGDHRSQDDNMFQGLICKAPSENAETGPEVRRKRRKGENKPVQSRKKGKEPEFKFHREGSSWVCECNAKRTSFKSKRDLIHHQITHTPKQIYCEICDASFRCPRELRRHQKTKTHLINSGARPTKEFQCDECGAKFQRDDGPERHRKEHCPRRRQVVPQPGPSSQPHAGHPAVMPNPMPVDVDISPETMPALCPCRRPLMNCPSIPRMVPQIARFQQEQQACFLLAGALDAGLEPRTYSEELEENDDAADGSAGDE